MFKLTIVDTNTKTVTETLSSFNAEPLLIALQQRNINTGIRLEFTVKAKRFVLYNNQAYNHIMHESFHEKMADIIRKHQYRKPVSTVISDSIYTAIALENK